MDLLLTKKQRKSTMHIHGRYSCLRHDHSALFLGFLVPTQLNHARSVTLNQLVVFFFVTQLQFVNSQLLSLVDGTFCIL
jgi:hypothetical protein